MECHVIVLETTGMTHPLLCDRENAEGEKIKKKADTQLMDYEYY